MDAVENVHSFWSMEEREKGARKKKTHHLSLEGQPVCDDGGLRG